MFFEELFRDLTEIVDEADCSIFLQGIVNPIEK
jgi:hypothetical protein